MALPTPATIQNLTRCKTLPGFFPGGFCDHLIRRIPFHDVTGYGQSVNINRAVLGAAANYAAGGALGVLASDTNLTNFAFKRIGDSVEVDSADITGSEETQQQLDLQVAMKKVSVIRQLSSQLIRGDGLGNNLTGLSSAVDAGQTLDPAGGANTAPTLADYHRIVARVCASDGSVGLGADALVMHPRTRRQLISLLEAAAGGSPQYAIDDTIDCPVLLFEGLPVYVDESVSTAETDAGAQTGSDRTSVYVVTLNGPTGLRVLHQGGSSSEFGIITEEVPSQVTVASMATIVRGFYSVLVPEIESIARLKAINIAAFPD